MLNLQTNQVNVAKAREIASCLDGKGLPSPGRILLIIPTSEQVTTGGIIVPGSAEKELPRKGVVIQFNQLENFPSMEVGTVITFGMYAGKEMNFQPEQIPCVDFSKYKFTIFSETEVIYMESNS